MPSGLPTCGGGSTAGPGQRKKFATPPVKIACLACRASRIRCNGGNPCANCTSRERECVYTPSRRGGARVRRKRAADPVHASDVGLAALDLNEVPAAPPDAIPVQTYFDAGAGLAQLQDWPLDSDFIFDSLFQHEGPNGVMSESLGEFPVDVPSSPVVRAYDSNEAILDAYYVFMHAYLPILPAPSTMPVDRPSPRTRAYDMAAHFESESPLGLAVAAILALIPHPDDTHHAAVESVLFRRRYAHFLAQAAVEAIEAEAELVESSIAPATALEAAGHVPSTRPRIPFHPGVPLELESIAALDILSIYEYAQRGNLRKMQTRAGQAMTAATALSLHVDDGVEDGFSEARRRVWWMTYVCMTQTSVVSNTKPAFEPLLHNFTRKFPVLQADAEAFKDYILAQDAILAASDFSIDLKNAIDGNADMTPVYEHMTRVDGQVGRLEAAAETFLLPGSTTTPVLPAEDVVARSLRCMARVKLSSARVKIHRYCAFADVPLFYGKHCDLTPLAPQVGDTPPSQAQVSAVDLLTPCDTVVTSPSDHSSSSSSSNSNSPEAARNFPFTTHQSARICLRSALGLTTGYENMPYPNPSGAAWPAGVTACALGPASSVVAPRTMPNFACCAMQCAYALLMMHQRTSAIYPDGDGPQTAVLVGSLLAMLQRGLASVLGSLENYATAFEALGGMRDQIRIAMDTHVPQAFLL